MYTFEFRFYPKSFEVPFIDEFDNKMQYFISALLKNGQILTANQNTVKYQDHYAYRVISPEMDSLDKKYYNKYCKEGMYSIIEQSLKEPEIQFIGENYDVQDSCSCVSPSHYILFTTQNSEEYPVICGDCKKSVPLYKLPKIYDDEYHDVLWWQWLYQACDMQFIGGIGERHGYKMLNDPNSELSKEGLRICAYLEEKVKKPFYYYLYKYYSKNKPVCPKCRTDWTNLYYNSIQYDYVCHNCRLVSND